MRTIYNVEEEARCWCSEYPSTTTNDHDIIEPPLGPDLAVQVVEPISSVPSVYRCLKKYFTSTNPLAAEASYVWDPSSLFSYADEWINPEPGPSFSDTMSNSFVDKIMMENLSTNSAV